MIYQSLPKQCLWHTHLQLQLVPVCRWLGHLCLAALNKIYSWLNDNKLSIHLGKTEPILFGSTPNLSKVDNFTIKESDNAMTRKKQNDCILQWNNYYKETCFLQRIAPLVGKYSLKTRKITHPHFDHGVHVYHNSTMAIRTKLRTAQNKLIRLSLNLPSRAHFTANLDRVQHLAMGLVYKINYTTKISMYLSEFLYVKDVYNSNTRGAKAKVREGE